MSWLLADRPALGGGPLQSPQLGLLMCVAWDTLKGIPICIRNPLIPQGTSSCQLWPGGNREARPRGGKDRHQETCVYTHQMPVALRQPCAMCTVVPHWAMGGMK